MGEKKRKFILSDAPLAMTLAQVRFEEVAKMMAFAPDIQELLRKKGFPVTEISEEHELTFISGKKGLQPHTHKTQTYNFLNRNRTEAISLGNGHLSLSVSDYGDFFGFSEKLEIALRALYEVAEPDLVTRIGFRHVNVLDSPNPKKDLVEGLRGVDIDGGDPNTNEAYSLYRKSHNRHLRIGVNMRDADKYLPENIGPGMKCRASREGVGNSVFVLDIDLGEVFESPYKDFKIKDILVRLDNLHKDVNEVFLKCVTKGACQDWGLQEI